MLSEGRVYHYLYSDTLRPHQRFPPGSLSMGFSRHEYWNGLPLPPPGNLPDPQIKPASPGAPALQADSFPDEPLHRGWLQRVLPTAFLWRLALSLTQMVDLWLPSAWTAPSQLTVNAWLMRATQAHPNPIDFKVQSGLQSCLQQRAGMPLGAFPSPILLPHPPLPRAPPPAPNT